MNCPKCGAPLDAGSKFCTNCGMSLQGAQGYANPSGTQSAQQNYQTNQQPWQSYQQPYQQSVNISNQIPEQYRPLSPWAYFGYGILFAIPLVGFICLIVFSINDKNINRRNYARSYWCVLILAVILLVILIATGATGGLAMIARGY